MRFVSVVELGGKTATGIEVPAEVVEQLAAGKRPTVTASINGHHYRTTVAVLSGRFLIPLSAENRIAARVSAGDQVEVDLELDTAPREVTVPDDLAVALRADPAAQASFATLSYSKRRGLVMAIDSAKADETRQRRVAKTVADLAAGNV